MLPLLTPFRTTGLAVTHIFHWVFSWALVELWLALCKRVYNWVRNSRGKNFTAWKKTVNNFPTFRRYWKQKWKCFYAYSIQSLHLFLIFTYARMWERHTHTQSLWRETRVARYIHLHRVNYLSCICIYIKTAVDLLWLKKKDFPLSPWQRSFFFVIYYS